MVSSYRKGDIPVTISFLVNSEPLVDRCGLNTKAKRTDIERKRQTDEPNSESSKETKRQEVETKKVKQTRTDPSKGRKR